MDEIVNVLLQQHAGNLNRAVVGNLQSSPWCWNVVNCTAFIIGGTEQDRTAKLATKNFVSWGSNVRA